MPLLFDCLRCCPMLNAKCVVPVIVVTFQCIAASRLNIKSTNANNRCTYRAKFYLSLTFIFVVFPVFMMLYICYRVRRIKMKLLRARGLPVLYLHRICLSIIISRLIYAISLWGGFLSAELTGHIDAFLCRLFRCGYTSTLLNIEDLLADADETLFIKVLRPGHCLYQLLPQRKLVSTKIRPSNHSCQLTICKYVSYKRSFIVRCLCN